MRIVITGAGSGIGRATALLIAHGDLPAGPHRLLLVDRDASALEAVAAEAGPVASTFVVDLSAVDSGDRTITAAVSAMGGIDAVVSNAGIIAGGALIDLNVLDFERMFAINTRASWLLAKAAYPHLRGTGGAFVATASLSASHATPALGFYSASKAALVMLVRQLSIEWGGEGIRCNTVSPGPTYTPMTANGYADRARRDQREAGIALRKLGQADDIAQAILFLIGPMAGHITGVDLIVDGGMNNMLMPLSGAGTGQTAPRSA